ncbi:unnamed protein product [Effrenium voratum]|uniref:Uncharacterized protein n=1 Tax=Effrenium voratum TaxID=2562239 RepID=A0AA36J9S9_9DINO|nr:unnamed protein product [Effrenium voratum]
MAVGREVPVGVSPWTHNVKCGMLVTCLYSMGTGLYQMTVLPSFILLVGGNNFDVGFAEGLQGMTNLISALPAGYVADKWSRKACIRIGCCFTLLSASCIIVAVLFAKPNASLPFAMLCASLGLQGISDGIINGPLVALMDDSCPTGRRSDVETANSMVYALSASVGPLLGLIVFVFSGDSWTLASMQRVIALGIAITLSAMIPACYMDDRYSLGEVSEAVHLQQPLTGGSPQEGERRKKTSCFGLITVPRVRLVMFCIEMILTTGAGMTVKFFPVFFKEEGHIRPVVLQGVFASLQLLTGVNTFVNNRLAKCCGRLQVIICCYVVGISCTSLLGLLKSYYTIPGVMLPIFMMRCTMQWSCGALMGSIIADYTPKASRGRWKALGSVTAMSLSDGELA